MSEEIYLPTYLPVCLSTEGGGKNKGAKRVFGGLVKELYVFP